MTPERAQLFFNLKGFTEMDKLLPGWKTYGAALGLLGLAIYQASQKEYQTAIQSFLAALGAAGLRSALFAVEKAKTP